jgi:hypothetical protein
VRSTRSPSWIERLLGFEPVPPPPHAFAVDVDELRYAHIGRGPQGLVLEDEQRVALPAETFQAGLLGGPLREARHFFEALTTLLTRVGKPIEEATLLLPDSWLRLVFTESEDLPRQAALRDDILRFKLKRLVPFRVEDLRVSSVEVQPFPDQQDPLRVLLGFAIEPLLAQLEAAFAASGIRIGRITNSTLALLAGLEGNLREGELAALLAVYHDSYALTYFRDGEPLIYRYKNFAEGGLDSESVARDLRMTLSFVRRHFPRLPIARAFLAAPPIAEERWLAWIGDELGAPAEALSYQHFSLLRARAGTSWLEVAPLVGATSLEVG